MSKSSNRGSMPPVSVSQNFLTSAQTIRRLLRLTSIGKNDHVIEIGAGRGHITRELVRVSGSVRAYEIDRGLCALLQEKLGNEGNLNIICRDFLKAALPKSGQYKVFANIPFSITSGIVRKLTCADNPPQEAWLVMEKGAAKRFMGTPRDTLASIDIKPFFDLRVGYHFSRQDFHPAPSVDTVLLHLVRKQQPDIPAAQRKSFSRFVETGLKHGINSWLTKRQITTALRLAGLPGIETPGAVLYVQWLCLFRCCRRLHGG